MHLKCPENVFIQIAWATDLRPYDSMRQQQRIIAFYSRELSHKKINWVKCSFSFFLWAKNFTQN